MSRFGKCVWPFTAGQTKVLVVLLLVVFGLVPLFVKIINDGSTTTVKGTSEAANMSATGK